MRNQEYILSHYKKLAKNIGLGKKLSMEDEHIRDVETDFIIGEIIDFVTSHNRFPYLLDLGCGNGQLLNYLQDIFPEMEMGGVEFSNELFKLCLSRNLKKCEIVHADIRKLSSWHKKVDIIVTERVLINLLTWKEQEKALRNIADILSNNGIYLMIESFQGPLKNLNKALMENKIHEFSPSKHNLFLKEGSTHFMKYLALFEEEGFLPSNYLSTHFFLSRVFHRYLHQAGGRKKGTQFVEFMNQALPSGIGNYSPILLKKYVKNKETYNCDSSSYIK